jgi:hypothetical protein
MWVRAAAPLARGGGAGAALMVGEGRCRGEGSTRTFLPLLENQSSAKESDGLPEPGGPCSNCRKLASGRISQRGLAERRPSGSSLRTAICSDIAAGAEGHRQGSRGFQRQIRGSRESGDDFSQAE